MNYGLRRFLAALVLVLSMMAVERAQGANVSWNAAASGNWNTPASWAGGFVPGNFDTAIFGVGGTYTVSLTANPPDVQAMLVNSGNVTLQSSGGVVRTLGISAAGGSNRLFTLGTSTLTVGNTTANTEVDLFIVNGVFVANSSTMTVRNSSDVNVIGGLEIGTIVDGNLTAGTATYTMTTGATTQIGGNLAIGSDAVSGVGGVLNISGTGTAFTQYNNVDVTSVTVGSVIGAPSAINIGTTTTGGTMTTGTGQLTINKTGTVTVGDSNSTGTLNVNGNILIDGGLLDSTGTFNWATGKVMSIVNGGVANFNVDTNTANNSVTNVSGFGSSLTTTGTGIDLSIVGGATVDVLSQGTLRTSGVLNVCNTGTVGHGTLVADGVATKVESIVTNATGTIGANGYVADVTFRNQAAGVFPGGLVISGSTTAGTTAYVKVESGADLTNLGNVSLASSGGTSTSGTVTVTGLGSSIVFGTGKTFTIGHATQGLAVVNVNDRASLDVGPTGTTVLNPTGTINIEGGTANLRTLTQNGGTINFKSGSLSYTGGLTVGSGGLLGTNLTLSKDHSLSIAGTATINSGSLLMIESGAGFNATTLANAGQMILTGLDAVATATTLNNTGLIRGEGRLVVGNFNNNSGGELRAEEGKLIRVQGTNGTNGGRVNLLGGTVQFSNPLANGFNGTITGRGTLIVGGTGLQNNNGNIAFSSGITDVFGDVANFGSATRGITVSGNSDVTFWDDVTNNAGSLFVVRTGSSATFFGELSGGGGIVGGGSVYVEADISPGASPAAVTYEVDLALSATARMNIELGGTIPNTQHDQITVTQALLLDGILNVTLINGFVPQLGQSFDILNWGTLSGDFAAIQLPTLTGGLNWNTQQLYTTGRLSVTTVGAGDFDGDGDVDGADFVAWQTNFPKPSGATTGQGDADGDGDVDGADFAVWQGSFPSGAGSTPVPEPAAGLLAIGAATPFLLCCFCWGRRHRAKDFVVGR